MSTTDSGRETLELQRQRGRPDSARSVLILLALLAGIGVLALDFYFGGPMSVFELRVAAAIDYHRFPELAPLMLALTQLGGSKEVGALALIVALFLLWRSRGGDALFLLIAVYGALLLNPVLKQLFDRARPLMDDPLLVLKTYAFPSGHTVAATALYGALALIAARYSRKVGPLAFIAAGILIALVGASRIYLGVHYVSDVFAGVLVGIAWLMLCRALVSGQRA